jgi:hypothetical protein
MGASPAPGRRCAAVRRPPGARCTQQRRPASGRAGAWKKYARSGSAGGGASSWQHVARQLITANGGGSHRPPPRSRRGAPSVAPSLAALSYQVREGGAAVCIPGSAPDRCSNFWTGALRSRTRNTLIIFHALCSTSPASLLVRLLTRQRASEVSEHASTRSEEFGGMPHAGRGVRGVRT